ncbi:MAG: response regulator [Burkholderiales bacterium]|nr:response regulator [Burkholderiales bacterium]
MELHPRLASSALATLRYKKSCAHAPACRNLIPVEKKDSILIVDDDPEIRELLVNYLARSGFDTVAAANGRELWQALDRHAIDLVVLDLMLPDFDGLTACRDLRSRSNLPVLMLTARGEEADRILGIEMGADDYLVKPFSPRELLARIKGILRRTRALPPNLRPELQRCLRFAGWKLDTATRVLTGSDGVATPLSGAEFRLLRILLDHPNRVLNRDQLVELIHGREAGPYDRAIDVQVSRLRQRLQDDGREARLIKTVRGEGYVLAAAVEGSASCD